MFTGNENHDITLADAKKLTKAYRDKAPSGAVLGSYFSKAALETVLAQKDCVGIQHYYGEDKDGKPVLVLVGVTANGDDLTGGMLLELGLPCPPFCKIPGPLNSD